MLSGVDRTSSQQSGPSAISATPTPNQAALQPLACTAAPTTGNATMKPMLITRA